MKIKSHAHAAALLREYRIDGFTPRQLEMILGEEWANKVCDASVVVRHKVFRQKYTLSEGYK